MNKWFYRVLLLMFSSVTVYFIGKELLRPNLYIFGGIIGFLLGLLIITIERSFERIPFKVIFYGILGLLGGLLLANLISYALVLDTTNQTRVSLLIYLFTNVLLGYLGLAIGLKKGKEVGISEFSTSFNKNSSKKDNIKILDTSVIIDGRVADICEIGFIDGSIVIPQFILTELQHIADSSDSIKRARGRRGLDILNRMQKLVSVDIKITDHDFPKIKDVDSKLVLLAKKLNGKIITNDFNLNKVAEFQGVFVLNINQLANALKPVILPGETMNVKILKEGKEQGQGIGYLDDGTMIVVDNARKYLGRNIDVTVTSVLQTSAGRMIFTKMKEEEIEEVFQNINTK